jgi:Ubiquitin-2 like Rad60 SUMO-like
MAEFKWAAVTTGRPMANGHARSGVRGDVLLRLALASGCTCDVSIADDRATIGDVTAAVMKSWPAAWAAETDCAAVHGMRVLYHGRYLNASTTLGDLQLPRDQYVTMHVVLQMHRGAVRRHGSGEFCCGGVVEAGRCCHRGSPSSASITIPASFGSIPSDSCGTVPQKGSFSYLKQSNSSSSPCMCLPRCSIM